MRAIIVLALVLLAACTPPPAASTRVVGLGDRVVAIVDVDDGFAPALSQVIEDQVVRLLGPDLTAEAFVSAREAFVMVGTLDRAERADGATVLSMVWTVDRPRGGLPFSFTVSVVPEVRDGRVTRAEIRGLAWLSAFDFMAHPQVQAALAR
ncbi:hypothetical protein FHS89_001609 [Rubricella aquisinus]|uniref:Uncharacterized protein n=1 Tax=Rubricella aquisinus TaxID=2028108 RepID=A0A840X4J2_9RHOB|nr:hypothetical protein [Rubricella aquisinus]MBB5515597.1 hypothetical protein [Rubricella aquisinus]